MVRRRRYDQPWLYVSRAENDVRGSVDDQEKNGQIWWNKQNEEYLGVRGGARRVRLASRVVVCGLEGRRWEEDVRLWC